MLMAELLLRLRRRVRHFERCGPDHLRNRAAAVALRAHVESLVAAVSSRHFHALQVRLKLATADARDLRTDTAQVLFLAARRHLIANLRALATNRTLPSHRSPRLANRNPA